MLTETWVRVREWGILQDADLGLSSNMSSCYFLSLFFFNLVELLLIHLLDLLSLCCLSLFRFIFNLGLGGLFLAKSHMYII